MLTFSISCLPLKSNVTPTPHQTPPPVDRKPPRQLISERTKMVLQSPTHDPCPGRTPGLRPTIRTHPETGQTAAARRKALKESCHNIQWLSLNVLDCQNGCSLDQHGTLLLEAHWRDRDRREGVLRESSRALILTPALEAASHFHFLGTALAGCKQQTLLSPA